MNPPKRHERTTNQEGGRRAMRQGKKYPGGESGMKTLFSIFASIALLLLFLYIVLEAFKGIVR